MAAESESFVFTRENGIYFAAPNANAVRANPMTAFLHIPKTAGHNLLDPLALDLPGPLPINRPFARLRRQPV